MVYLNVILTVRDANDVNEIRELLAEQRRLSLQEPGCLRFEVYHSQADPKVFILNERWETEQALDVHRSGYACEHVYKPKVLPKVDRVPHVCEIVE